jgi:hypothetical protein
MNKKLINRILELSGLVEDKDTTNDEYYTAIEQYYSPRLLDIIKSGESMAKRMTGSGSLITKISDNDNVMVRWVEGNNTLVILGLVSKIGKIFKSDLPDISKWSDYLIKKIEKGFTIYTSPNDLSMPILNKILKKADKMGIPIEKNVMSGSFSDSGQTWTTLQIKINS